MTVIKKNIIMLTPIRKNERNQFERRTQDRRMVDFKFASREWVEHVKQNYVAWPKVERRKNFRRDGERRYIAQDEQVCHLKHDYTCDLLSEEEKLYFDQLFMKNSD